MPDTELIRMRKSIHIWGEWRQPLAWRTPPYIYGASGIKKSTSGGIRRSKLVRAEIFPVPINTLRAISARVPQGRGGLISVANGGSSEPAPWLHAMIRWHWPSRCANTVTLRAHPAKMRLPCATIRHQERPARRSFSEIARQGTAPLCPPPDRAQTKRRSIHGHVFPR